MDNKNEVKENNEKGFFSNIISKMKGGNETKMSNTIGTCKQCGAVEQRLFDIKSGNCLCMRCYAKAKYYKRKAEGKLINYSQRKARVEARNAGQSVQSENSSNKQIYSEQAFIEASGATILRCPHCKKKLILKN